MNKKLIIITLIITAIVGSIITFYASNLFFADVANFGAGFSKTTLFVSFPAMLFGAIILMIPFYVLRLYQRPNTKKVLTRNYLFIVMALSVFGIIFTFLAGLINLHSFVKPNPFPGYLIISFVLFGLILVGSAVALFKFVLPLPEDTEKYKVTVKHVFHTLGLYLLVALAFNRFGAFLFIPVYVQWSTFYMTFVYYLFLLIPMALLVIRVLRTLNIGGSLFIPAMIVAVVNVVLMLGVMLLGKLDSAFISAVSPAAPLERLASMPVELFIHCFVYFGVSVYYIIYEKAIRA